MARSNKMPIGSAHRIDHASYSNKKPLERNATTISNPNSKRVNSEPKHHIKTPKAHTPFRQHNDKDSLPTTSSPSRPTGINRQNSVQTRYMNMLLAMDTIPRFHNILASFFTWVLLAGFLVFPGTFTSLQRLDEKPENEAAAAVLKTVKNIPLIYVGTACCGIGAGGMIWLWWTWRSNFVWLLNRVFLPGCLNSFAGLISTLINVYSQQDGVWSTTAWITAAVTGACVAVTGVLFALYNFWILERVKRRHGLEMEGERVDEGLVEKVERKTREPGLEPGSVV